MDKSQLSQDSARKKWLNTQKKRIKMARKKTYVGGTRHVYEARFASIGAFCSISLFQRRPFRAPRKAVGG